MNLYRIHYAWKSGGASSGEIDYYEDDEQLKVALLDHHLDIMSEYNGRRGNNWLRLRMADAWRRHRGNEDKRRRTTRIIKVEKVVNDEWVPVKYDFIEPAVSLGGRIRNGA